MTILSQDSQVAHVVGSSRRSRRVGGRTWKQYWEYKTERPWPDRCQMGGCDNKCILGAHVYIRGNQGRAYQNFILPCCQDCNNNGALRYQSRNTPNWKPPKDGAIVVKAPTSIPDEDDMVTYLPCSREGRGKFCSWKKFWKHHTRNRNNWPICQKNGCEKEAQFGARVEVRQYPGIFILPSCWDCYLEVEAENEFETKSNAKFAWVKVKNHLF